MVLPPFAIGEWLLCPRCGIICDAPFRPAGSDASEPELILGSSFPEIDAVPSGDWRVEVGALCPVCGTHIAALAVFEGPIVREFIRAANA
jgi:hypothetical protein